MKHFQKTPRRGIVTRRLHQQHSNQTSYWCSVHRYHDTKAVQFRGVLLMGAKWNRLAASRCVEPVCNTNANDNGIVEMRLAA